MRRRKGLRKQLSCSHTSDLPVKVFDFHRVPDYDDVDHDVIWKYPMEHQGIGGEVTFAAGDAGPRTYSLAATVLRHCHRLALTAIP